MLSIIDADEVKESEYTVVFKEIEEKNKRCYPVVGSTFYSINRQNFVSCVLQRQDLHLKASKSCRQSEYRIDENISMQK